MQYNQIELQNEIIEAVLNLLDKYNSIDGVFLVGSHAVDQNTAFSDIDLCILFKTDERNDLKEIHDNIGIIEPTLSTLYLFNKEGLFLFENG